jgi:hypothetical protein
VLCVRERTDCKIAVRLDYDVLHDFLWAAARGNLPTDTTRNGYHLVFWKTGDLANCAVSDMGWDKLRGLARLLRDFGAPDNRE